METIKVSNKNNSLYVIISTAPFQEGEKCPQSKEDNRLPYMAYLIPNYIISQKFTYLNRFSAFLNIRFKNRTTIYKYLSLLKTQKGAAQNRSL